MKYVYVVWFRDRGRERDDPDVEWPACFVVVGADDDEVARTWGDQLSARYASTHEQDVLRSQATPVDMSELPNIKSLPIVGVGEWASDDEIGW